MSCSSPRLILRQDIDSWMILYNPHGQIYTHKGMELVCEKYVCAKSLPSGRSCPFGRHICLLRLDWDEPHN